MDTALDFNTPTCSQHSMLHTHTPGFLSTSAVTSSSGLTAPRLGDSAGEAADGEAGDFIANRVAPAACRLESPPPPPAPPGGQGDGGGTAAPPSTPPCRTGAVFPLPGAPGCFSTGGTSWCSRTRPPQLPICGGGSGLDVRDGTYGRARPQGSRKNKGGPWEGIHI